MEKDKLISDGYSRAGVDFLAADLEPMFRILRTPEDVALHNVITKKVFDMIGQDKIEVNRFYRTFAGKLLQERVKKSFLRQLCEVLIGEQE